MTVDATAMAGRSLRFDAAEKRASARSAAAAGGTELLEDLVERSLHERVEPLGRLVKNGKLRIVLERLDDTNLLAHAA